MEILIGMGQIDPLSNCDPRRRQELADSRMIQEDHNAMANCSPRVINRQFNAGKYPERLAMYNQSTRTKGQE
jgi:hypothetical protein